VTSDFRPEVEILPSRSCAMHPAIIGTVRSLLWTWLWGRYHVPQNVFLVLYKPFRNFNLRWKAICIKSSLPHSSCRHLTDSQIFILKIFLKTLFQQTFIFYDGENTEWSDDENSNKNSERLKNSNYFELFYTFNSLNFPHRPCVREHVLEHCEHDILRTACGNFTNLGRTNL